MPPSQRRSRTPHPKRTSRSPVGTRERNSGSLARKGTRPSGPRDSFPMSTRRPRRNRCRRAPSSHGSAFGCLRPADTHVVLVYNGRHAALIPIAVQEIHRNRDTGHCNDRSDDDDDVERFHPMPTIMSLSMFFDIVFELSTIVDYHHYKQYKSYRANKSVNNVNLR